MIKYSLFYVVLVVLFIANPLFSQDREEVLKKVDKCIEDYKTLSRLGPGYTREVIEESIDNFRNLFERDAFLFWDIDKEKSDSIPPNLTITEYIERTKAAYFLKQPVLDYPKKATINLSDDNRSCIVYLTKTNTIMDENDEPLRTITVRLKLNLVIKGLDVKIRNISEDKRNTRVRSITPAINYIAWDNVVSSFTNDPASAIMPSLTDSLWASVSSQFQYGAAVEVRLNTEIRDGISVLAGVYYSKVTYSIQTRSYERRILDTLDATSEDPFSISVIDRSKGLSEELLVTSIEIPIALKKYFKPWLYAKGGIQLSFTSATSDIAYNLSRTGGGRIRLINDPTISRKIEVDEELDIARFGFFKDSTYAFSEEQDINKLGVSLVLGVGIEKQFNRFSLGIEPNFRIGTNPLYQSAPKSDLMLKKGTGQVCAENGDYTGLISTMDLPSLRFNAGVSFFVSYLFKH